MKGGERIRSAVAAGPFHLTGRTVTVTVSGGCSSKLGAGPEDLVRAADTGLYEAKAAGRNRIIAG